MLNLNLNFRVLLPDGEKVWFNSYRDMMEYIKNNNIEIAYRDFKMGYWEFSSGGYATCFW